MDDPILRYSMTSLPPSLIKKEILLYEDGRILYEDKEINIGSSKAVHYVERLVNVGFFGFISKSNPLAFKGKEESVTLNYQGRSKTVRWQNTPSQQEVSKVISELEDLCSSETWLP